MTIKLNISDREFSHDICSVAGQTPKHFVWSRDGTGNPDFHFYTNRFLFEPLNPTAMNIAWLIEPENIAPEVAIKFHEVADNFDLILTHSSKVLNRYRTARFCFGGGNWLNGRLPTGGGENKIYPKSKLCSIISSTKCMVPLHQFRIEMAKKLYWQTVNGRAIDVFGQIVGTYKPIVDSLADYRYHIAIENFVDDYYWTEKITSAILAGCVPVYLGARKLHHVYNPDGFITFSNEKELIDVLSNINEDDYERRLPAIRENFEIALDFQVMENFIYEQYLQNILGNNNE